MRAWCELEQVIRTASDQIKEGIIREPVSLKLAIKDAKAMLEEVVHQVERTSS